MRIDLNLGNIESLHRDTTRRAGENSKHVNADNKLDSAVLSSGDSNVSHLTASAMALSDVRAERVAELRKSISTGTYSVEPGAIADALLKSLF